MEEIWKPAIYIDEKGKIWDFTDYYEISNFGNIRSLDRLVFFKDGRIASFKGKLRIPKLGNAPYKCIELRKGKMVKICLIHRLVALAFVPNPDNLIYVNHKDENKLNNNADNLEWCTKSYNCKYGTGTKRRIEKRIRPILQYTKDFQLVAEYPSIKEASEKNNISSGAIINVCAGRYNTAHNYIWRYKESA